ncbi:MAG: transglycosylase SLT domain-containing protein [Anaerolineales bacterium]|nr:transglycosylase SLT domain-containing protein [Anaerolineales bacterium]
MAFTKSSAQIYKYGRPAELDLRRPSSAGYHHILIAVSITMLALFLISTGWISLKKAIQKGVQPVQISPPGPIIQLSHFSDPSFLASPIASLFTPEVQQWSDDILRWSETYNLDPNFIATVMQIESCGYPEALSRVGAEGLFQVMPYHFSDGEHPYDPDINALRGLSYLKRSLELAGGDERLALAGYNGGHGVITLSMTDWPEETRRYVYWGTGIYEDARKNKTSSDRLDEWLSAGGAGLCAQSNSFSQLSDE